MMGSNLSEHSLQLVELVNPILLLRIYKKRGRQSLSREDIVAFLVFFNSGNEYKFSDEEGSPLD